MLSLFKKKATSTPLYAYVSGTLCPIVNVPDEIFSKKLMGDGIAIIAQENIVYAPCDGEITLIAPTKHAIAIQLDNGTQILLHIGLDSALHKDDVFEVIVKQQDYVHRGDPIVKMKDAFVKSSTPLYIPLVVVENPQDVVFHFSNEKEEVIGQKSTIAHYE